MANRREGNHCPDCHDTTMYVQGVKDTILRLRLLSDEAADIGRFTQAGALKWAAEILEGKDVIDTDELL